MRGQRELTGFCLLMALSAGTFTPAAAQPGRIGRAVVREVKRTAEELAVGATRCALGNTRCVEDAKKAGKPVVITDANDQIITDENGRPISDPAEAANRAQKPGEGVWRNYDFVPGKTVWRATDFSAEPVGRFPAKQLEFVSGNMQIVEFEGARVLEATSSSVVRVKLPEALPTAFTIEFYLRIPAGNIGTYLFTSPRTTSIARHPHDYVYLYHTPGIYRIGREISGTQSRGIVANMVPVKLQVNDTWAIMYVGSERVSQVPTANFGRTDAVEFHIAANARFPAYLTDIVVAVGLDELYETLAATGEFTTRGILFDSDSDKLRPESTPTLEELRTALNDHADLKVLVEGHTDGQGEDAHNMDLSRRRAAAVVAYLTSNGIAANRLTSEGKGESVPVGDNATAEGRQQNRRVVIRKVE
jgi:outer membrane protein OmpA-like peptidoglycan-associated protein